MEAAASKFADLFVENPVQYKIPIYQRSYSWKLKTYKKLWEDICNISKNDTHSHFIGSIIYVTSGNKASGESHFVIDGQQRLITLSLLMHAISKNVKVLPHDEIDYKTINNTFLLNTDMDVDKRLKLILTDKDMPAYMNIINDQKYYIDQSQNLISCYNFFSDKIKETEISMSELYNNICELKIVQIKLLSNDSPQLVFESLNSTGTKLSQSDLIRNFIFIDMSEKIQIYMYQNYWSKIERRLDTLELKNPSTDKTNFDRFMCDYLSMQLKIKLKGDDIYDEFRKYFDMRFESNQSKNKNIENILIEINKYSDYYVKLFNTEYDNTKINSYLKYIKKLKTNAVYPFLLAVFDDYKKRNFNVDDMILILGYIESYIFRRAICGLATNSLSNIFIEFIYNYDHRDMNSLKNLFVNNINYANFPNDDEFKNRFEIMRIYNIKSTSQYAKYALDRLTNFENSEPINTDNCTVEHIMPQKIDDTNNWKILLGLDWKNIQTKYLHTIGNLTLTTLNSELGNKSFEEKKKILGRLDNNISRLNNYILSIPEWNENEIKRRAECLSKQALKIWIRPNMTNINMDTIPEIDDEESFDDKELGTKIPEYWINNMNPDTYKLVNNLITMIEQQHSVTPTPNTDDSEIYIRKPNEKDNLFVVIRCGKNVASLYFRTSPNFSSKDNRIKIGRQFYFSHKYGLAKIYIKEENFDLIMDKVQSAFDLE